jgi:hypothetical protein
VAVVVKKLVDMAFTLYLINQPNMLSAEFHTFLTQVGVTQVIPNVNGTNVLVIAFCVLIIIGSIAETVKAIKNTVQAHTK